MKTKMRKIKFNNGKFGIRIGRWWHARYLFTDLERPMFSWSITSDHFYSCMGDEKRVDEILLRCSNKYKLVR